MTLTERIAEDMKSAMKAGRRLELETLRTIRAAILEFEKKQAGSTLGPDDEVALLSNAAKRRREAIEQYSQAGRTDLAEQERLELEIISRYLPQQMSADELDALVRRVIEETGAAGMQDLGKVMGPVMKAARGRADGAAVQALVRSRLGGA